MNTSSNENPNKQTLDPKRDRLHLISRSRKSLFQQKEGMNQDICKRVNKIWSYDDLCFIGKNYATMTQFQLAYHFGVSESVMEACIRRYGFKKYRELWTEQLISYLRLKYPVTTATALAKEMNLPYSSVKYAIERFRISKKIKARKSKVQTKNALCCSECGSENIIIKKERVNVEQ